MGLRGPAPKPLELRSLLGNPGGRPMPRAVAQLPALDPEPPAHMTARAAAVWREVVPRLALLNVAKVTDAEALVSYCELVAIQREAARALAAQPLVVESDDGMGGSKFEANVYLAVLERVTRLAMARERIFGLGPSFRAGLAAAGLLAAADDQQQTASALMAKFRVGVPRNASPVVGRIGVSIADEPPASTGAIPAQAASSRSRTPRGGDKPAKDVPRGQPTRPPRRPGGGQQGNANPDARA